MEPLVARRALLGAVLVSGVAAAAAEGAAATAWDFAFPDIDGGTLALGQFRGRVLLVTNTASFCGYTYQYAGLEKLQRDLSPRGLTVVGVPSQDFDQESDSNGKVKAFCEATFGVKFPMAGISHVRGGDAAPFYAWVRGARGGWEPQWNFNKVLIGRDGAIKGTYRSGVEPDSPALLQAVEAELAQTA
jgi:glutathione peroxidase